MNVIVKEITSETIDDCVRIWNKVVDDGRAFPQTDGLKASEAADFFAQQSYAGAAIDQDTDEVVGMYTLHPNNIGRCGHLCNASYAVRSDMRGNHIGEYLVADCIEKGRELGFRVLQFNAVVKSNIGALKLYKKMGFTQLGTIPGGFRNIDGEYEDIILHYIEL